MIKLTSYFFKNRFWRGMYSRFESGVHPREPLGDLLLASKDHSTSLEDHVQHLTKVSLNYIISYRIGILILVCLFY